MGTHRWLPGSGQLEQVIINAYREGPDDWSLITMRRRQGEHVWDVDRSRYESLTANELLDIVDATIASTIGAL